MKDEIEKEIDCDIDSDKWISTSKNTPEESNVFYVKINDKVSKAIYLFAPIIGTPHWWHPTLDEYINDDEITHWMNIN